MVFILHVSKRYAYLTSSEFWVFIPSADIAQWGRWTWLPCTAPPSDPDSPFCGCTPSWRSVSLSGFPSEGEPAATHLWKCLSFLPRAWRTVLKSSLEVVFPQESEGLCQVPPDPGAAFQSWTAFLLLIHSAKATLFCLEACSALVPALAQVLSIYFLF